MLDETVVGLLACGNSVGEVLQAYPYLYKEDVQAALSYAAWRAEEVELPLQPSREDPRGHEPLPSWVEFLATHEIEAVKLVGSGRLQGEGPAVMEWARQRGLIVFTHDLVANC